MNKNIGSKFDDWLIHEDLKQEVDSKVNERIGAWICCECGKKYGKYRFNCSTWHQDTCNYCGKENAIVTESRDFGFPKIPEKD